MADLTRLLRPRSVAVVGGGTWCANVLGELAKIGFDGPVWHVHPSRGFADIAALPAAPDAAFIGVNAAASVDIVAALSARGAGGATCFASGFAEAQAEIAGSEEVQDRLLAAAGKMPILGPNCYGFLNYLDRVALWPDQHGGAPCDTGVALITQSSNIAINLTMQKRGLPIAYVVTAGNQAQQRVSDLGQALLADPRVTALGVHIEGIGDVDGFAELARAAWAAGKPIVALKIGASEQARAATVSHTASLAGSETGAKALLSALGVAQVNTLDALLEGLKIAHLHGRLPSAAIASMSCSGGEASLMADLGARHGVVYPPLEEIQTVNLRAALGPRVALANPLDYHTYIWGDEDAMAHAFSAMMTPDHALGVLVLDTPRDDRCDPSAWEPTFRAARRAQEMSGRPIAILASLPETLPEALAARLMGEGLLPMAGLSAALEAIAALGSTVEPKVILAAPRSEQDPKLVAEPDAKARLHGFGLDVPSGTVAAVESLCEVAQDMRFPVVLKSLGLAHKSETGGVVLGLTSTDTLLAAASEMGHREVYVEEMVPGAVAELLVGVVNDPAHGLVLTLGRGGTETELHADVATRLLPVSAADVTDMLQSLRCWPLLQGYRGRPAADLDAILRAVNAIQKCVLASPRVVELEINPLLCLPDRAVAADALIREGRND